MVFSSTIVMIIFWAMLPFQNVLFAQSVVPRVETLQLSQQYELIARSEQTKAFPVNFLYTSYNTA